MLLSLWGTAVQAPTPRCTPENHHLTLSTLDSPHQPDHLSDSMVHCSCPRSDHKIKKFTRHPRGSRKLHRQVPSSHPTPGATPTQSQSLSAPKMTASHPTLVQCRLCVRQLPLHQHRPMSDEHPARVLMAKLWQSTLSRHTVSYQHTFLRRPILKRKRICHRLSTRLPSELPHHFKTAFCWRR